MAYTLSVSEQPGYLHFRVTGRNGKDAVIGYLTEVVSTCMRAHCPIALIEENLSGPSLELGEIFQIASAGSSTTAPAIRAIAVVDVNPEHSLEKMKFAENVAVTRGTNVRMFDSMPAAQDWVRGQVTGLRDVPS